MNEKRANETLSPMNDLPKVALVEEHSFYRKGLCFAIKRFKFVKFGFEACNGKDFLDKQHKTPADIVIMNILMPDADGYDVIMAVKKDFPNVKILVLTSLVDYEIIQRILKAGVSGYLLKNIDSKVLETALKAVISGNHYYSEEIMEVFNRKIMKELKKQESIKLTKRESEILELIFQGFSNQEIADKLFISIRTVTNHRFNLMTKTSTRNTVSLIHYCVQNNLIHSDYPPQFLAHKQLPQIHNN